MWHNGPMDIYLTGNRALALLRESRRGDAPPLCEETAAVAAPLEGPVPPLEGLGRIAPLAFADVSPSRPMDLVVPDGDMRHRSATIHCQVCGTARAGSFIRLGIPSRELEAAGLPNDLRVYIDSPCRIFLVAAQSLSRFVHAGRIDQYEALFHLLSLGSELCGGYARDPASPFEGKIAYRIPQVVTVSDISCYLARCGGARGLTLARKAAQYLADGMRSPLESEFYFALTLPPRLGGIGFPKPLVNNHLVIAEKRDDFLMSKPNRSARAQDDLSRSLSFPHGDEITPDMQWPLPEAGLVIEIDGYSHHSDKDSFRSDRFRDQYYKSHDYQVLRITYDNMASAETLENTLALVIKVASSWLSQSRVENLKKNLKNPSTSRLRATLTSVMGPRKKAATSD